MKAAEKLKFYLEFNKFVINLLSICLNLSFLVKYIFSTLSQTDYLGNFNNLINQPKKSTSKQ